ncbi:ATP-binding protein [Achromobacter dolens]|uniref:sensor histidine kinase n=1 Tax=Achromobacter TaxID=222 RepID=UPI0011A75664|nr:ATP-binding protein [Achromobacter dolens]MCZ8407577.1 ATP-binding protein [Achromobacter dolens]
MSLRTRLSMLLGVVWLVVGGAVTLWMFEHASAQLDAALDSRLAASAAMVTRLVTQWPRDAAVGLPDMAAASGAPARGGIACEVGAFGAGATPAFTVARARASLALQAAPLGFGSFSRAGATWRTYAVEAEGMRVATACRTDIRAELRREMAWTALLPGVAGLLVGFALLWFGVGRGLALVEGLRRRLACEAPWPAHDLPGDKVPRELMPFTQTLTHLSQRMEDMLLRERHFSDHAAHEMRSPVTAIKAHLQVLERLPAMAGDAASRQAVAHALQGTARLERLIEQLLMLARADGDDADAACDALAVLARVASRKPARVRWHLPASRPWAALPDALLDCAVRNLVDNALKYSPAHADVQVHVSIAAADLVVTVRDRGPGLTPAQCARAVEPFWRGGRQGEGAGLGLSIVAAIARRHGGALALESTPGAGLRCRLSVPLALAAGLSPRSANSGDRETVPAGPTPA